MENVIKKTVKTFTARIYIAGDMATIKQICRKYCYIGLCVNISSRDYIYTGGEESGACIELVNYPRFPENPSVIFHHAMTLAIKLMKGCFQHSFLIVTPEKTTWITRRKQ